MAIGQAHLCQGYVDDGHDRLTHLDVHVAHGGNVVAVHAENTYIIGIVACLHLAEVELDAGLFASGNLLNGLLDAYQLIL